MARYLQLAFMVVMLLVVSLTAAQLQPMWARDLRMEGFTAHLSDAVRRLFDTTERNLGPNTTVMEAVLTKDRIVADLIDGRLTLFETAALFQRLNVPGYQLDQLYPGDSEEERLCQQVIQTVWARRHKDNQDPSDTIVRRLQEELSRHKQQHGTVVLPSVPIQDYSSPLRYSAAPLP